jgi:hypothetical protein
MASKKLEIEIYGELFEILYLKLTDAKFKKYLKNGIPDEDEDEEAYYDFIDELESGDGESGILTEDTSTLSILINVNGSEIKEFENLYKTAISKLIYPVQKILINNNFLVRIQTGANASWKLKTKGEFDIKKFKFEISRYELTDGSIYHELSPSYNDEEFEYQDGDGFNTSEMLLVDKQGKIHTL